MHGDDGDDGDNNLEWEVSDLTQLVEHRPLRLLMIRRMAMIMTMMIIMIMVVVMIMMIMMMMMMALAVHSWQITPMSSPWYLLELQATSCLVMVVMKMSEWFWWCSFWWWWIYIIYDNFNDNHQHSQAFPALMTVMTTLMVMTMMPITIPKPFQPWWSVRTPHHRLHCPGHFGHFSRSSSLSTISTIKIMICTRTRNYATLSSSWSFYQPTSPDPHRPLVKPSIGSSHTHALLHDFFVISDAVLYMMIVIKGLGHLWWWWWWWC